MDTLQSMKVFARVAQRSGFAAADEQRLAGEHADPPVELGRQEFLRQQQGKSAPSCHQAG